MKSNVLSAFLCVYPRIRLSFPGKESGENNFAASVVAQTLKSAAPRLRTPDVVEFAGSPQVGQAVLACPLSYSNSGPNSVRAGRRHRLPHPRSSRHRKEWLSPFSPPGRNCRARSGGLRLVSALREPHCQEGRDESRPRRQECLRHIATTDNVKLFLRRS
jgi:hypothetical protein